MKQKMSLSIIKNSVIILSIVVAIGSGYLLIASPTQAIEHSLFKGLVVLLAIDLVLFVCYKINSAKSHKASNPNNSTTHQSRKTKDPKPHSKK